MVAHDIVLHGCEYYAAMWKVRRDKRMQLFFLKRQDCEFELAQKRWPHAKAAASKMVTAYIAMASACMPKRSSGWGKLKSFSFEEEKTPQGEPAAASENSAMLPAQGDSFDLGFVLD